MQPMNPTVIVVSQPGLIDKQSQYKNMRTTLANQLTGLGSVQIVIGVLCIIFQGVDIGSVVNNYYISNLAFVGHGFWNGILFLITGAFGIAGGIRRSRCQVVAFNVLSILSACFAACIIGIAIPSAILSAYNYYCRYYSNSYPYSYSYYSCRDISKDWRNTAIAMESMMAILGLIEGIVAIWSSAVCCKIGACCCDCDGSCCCPPSSTSTQLVYPAGQQFSQQQPFVIGNQQNNFTNQQQPMFLPMGTVFVNPQQQSVQYNPQQPSAYTALSPVAANQGLKTQEVAPGGPKSGYEEMNYDNY